MAWDSSKPPASGYLQSAEIRANWSAIELQALGQNLLGDPDFTLWAGGSVISPPAWWNRNSTTLAVTRASSVIGATCTAKKMHAGQYMAKLSHGGATGRFYQNVLSSGDDIFTDNRHLMFTDSGQSASGGAWLYTNSNDCKLYINLGTCVVLSSACPTNQWTWKTVTATITSDAASLGLGVQLDAAGTAYVGCPTMVLGPIPPKNFIPAPYHRGTIFTQLTGNPPPQSGATGAFRFTYHLPWRVDDICVEALSAASTSKAWIITLKKLYASSVVELTSVAYRPGLSVGASRYTGLTFRTTYMGYNHRCFAARVSSGFEQNLFELAVFSSTVGAGGKDPVVMIRTGTYQPPLLAMRSRTNYK